MSRASYGGPVFVSTAVWGLEYTDFFISFCVPALLSLGNLPILASRPGSRFILHTTADDLEHLNGQRHFSELRSTIELDVRLIADLARPAHTVQAECHAEAMHAADEQNAPIVFISPDTIWSDGTFRRLLEILDQGKRVVFLTNFRAVKEDALPALEAIKARQAGPAISLSGREITRLALDYLHPTIDEHFFDAGRGEKLLPCSLLWEAPNGDLLARSFHCHPLMVFPRKRFARFYQTIDGDLVRYACPDESDWHVVTDSDEMTCVEISKRSHFIGGICAKADIGGVRDWALKRANQVHWRLFAYPVRMHANPVEPADWAAIEIRAARLANEVISSRRRRRVLIWTRQTAIAAISQLTGLPEWEISERKFRLQWRLTFWWRETYIRRISPLLKDPFGWLHRAIFRVLVPRRPPPDLDERLFRVRWNIYHACLSFYRRRISATCLAPFAYARRRIARMQASKLHTLRKSSSSSKTPDFVMSARQVRTAERRKNRIRRQRKGIESQA